MAISNISDYYILSFLTSLIYHYSTICRDTNKNRMLLHENNFNNLLVFKAEFITWINPLELFSSLTTKLSDESSCISNKKSPALKSKLTGSNIRLTILFIKLCEQFFKRSSIIVVHSYII